MANQGYALITGAGSGLGKELALLLATQDIPVVLVGRNQAKLSEVLSQSKTSSAVIAVADMSSETDVNRVFNEANSIFGRPSLAISCAGVGIFGDVGSFSQSQIEGCLRSNLISTILVAQRAFLEMKGHGGTIVNVMSTASNTARAKESLYCAAKFGARGFTESLRLEAKGTGVKVMAVYPGGMKTPFWSKDCGLTPDTSTFMEPREVAQAIVDNLNQGSSLQISDLTINRV